MSRIYGEKVTRLTPGDLLVSLKNGKWKAERAIRENGPGRPRKHKLGAKRKKMQHKKGSKQGKPRGERMTSRSQPPPESVGAGRSRGSIWKEPDGAFDA